MSSEPMDLELFDAKQIKALRKEYGDAAVKEFVCMSDEQLKATLSSGLLECEEADRQTKSNSAYAEAVAVKKDFDTALREKKRPVMRKVKAAAFILGVRKEGRK